MGKVRLGRRLTVRLQTLDLRIGVRIPASQPNRILARDKTNRCFPRPSAKRSHMTARIAWISLSVLLLPLLVRAQTVAPEVEQALRARVTEFLQYHVDGNFRKAYDMVAEDTKDQYFNTGKVKLQSFTIDNIKFTDNFTRAAVTATMAKTVNVAGTDIPVALPSTITWKIENGKWVWYSDAAKSAAWATPIGL